jgi:hypothetical protein
MAELFYGIANISTIAQLTLRTSVVEGTLETVPDRHEIEPPPVNIFYPQGRFIPPKSESFCRFRHATPSRVSCHNRNAMFGAMMEFGSVVGAVTFAVEVQITMRQRNSGVT